MPTWWHSVGTHPPDLQKSVCKLLKTKKRGRENAAKRGQRGGKSKKIGELQVGMPAILKIESKRVPLHPYANA
jgi:hypothetical protein